ncbi:PLP-dependent aminotransferase family protein [Paenibacillus terrigena]|uniref:MocR-like pyridoxine biosynthesis transcription factor PdxR n=1 Tax=Paenibacillus terrigena TaxID=369333 RepID=UPI0003753350|nr:PLP-dependent aminotransferase family protein [Paenibacillus terrigena]
MRKVLMSKLDPDAKAPQYAQLYEQVKTAITEGELTEHMRMPSIRSLAGTLGVSATTVELAYSQLVAEGFLDSQPKRGYYVQKLPDPYRQAGGNESRRALSVVSSIPRTVPARDNREYQYDFHLSKNDHTIFPFELWRRLSNQVLRQSNQDLLFYGDPQGEYGLRVQISNYLRQFRGCECSPEQVVIGSSQHHLLSLMCHLLKGRLQHIGVENPGYLLHAETFRQQGLQVCPIPLQDNGMQVEEVYARQVQAVCVSPSHQYPRGIVMPIAKRLQLLEWAEHVQGYIIEDDYDGEFRYHGRVIPSLQGLQGGNRVIYLGGFSQVLAPAFCIHYMVLPPDLIAVYQQVEYKMLLEQSASRIHQCTLQAFMERGHLEKHIRKMRKRYGQKHDLLIQSIQEVFGERAIMIGKDAGFHILLRIDHPLTEHELVLSAREAGVRVASAAHTWIESSSYSYREFFIGFAGIELERIEPGIKRLYDVWFQEQG